MKLISVLNLARTLLLTSSGFISLAEVTPACEVTNNKSVPIVRNYNLINDQPHPKLTNEQFDNLIRDLGAKEFAVREKTSNTLKARLQDCPISYLETFIKRLQKANSDLEVKRRIELSLRLPLFNERLRNINNDNEKLEYIGALVRVGIFFNPIDHKKILLGNLDKLSNETIRFLVQHGDEGIKWEIAANPKTPGDILTMLSQDQGDFVRWEVATNPNTPEDTLTKLSQDQNPNVRIEANRQIGYRKISER